MDWDYVRKCGWTGTGIDVGQVWVDWDYIGVDVCKCRWTGTMCMDWEYVGVIVNLEE